MHRVSIQLKPQERYALVGKTRRGKTALARTLSPPWEVWWLDTKNDPNAASAEDRQPEKGGLANVPYFIIKETHDRPNLYDYTKGATND